MLPDEVREAMERLTEPTPCDYETYKTIRAHLLAREAEVERHVKMLADCFRMAGADTDGNEDWRIAPDALRAVTDLRRDYDDVLDWQARAERAEALLREVAAEWEQGGMPISIPLHDRITAHLSENSR